MTLGTLDVGDSCLASVATPISASTQKTILPVVEILPYIVWDRSARPAGSVAVKSAHAVHLYVAVPVQLV